MPEAQEERKKLRFKRRWHNLLKSLRRPVTLIFCFIGKCRFYTYFKKLVVIHNILDDLKVFLFFASSTYRKAWSLFLRKFAYGIGQSTALEVQSATVNSNCSVLMVRMDIKNDTGYRLHWSAVIPALPPFFASLELATARQGQRPISRHRQMYLYHSLAKDRADLQQDVNFRLLLLVRGNRRDWKRKKK